MFFIQDMTKHILTDTSYALEDRPLIGITMSPEPDTTDRRVVELIRQAEGTAVLLPYDPDEVRLPDTLHRCDGVVMISSGDEQEQQAYETALCTVSLRFGLPTLTIGMQMDELLCQTDCRTKGEEAESLYPEYPIIRLQSVESLTESNTGQLVDLARYYHEARIVHDNEIVLDGCIPARRLADPLGRPLVPTLVDGGVDYLCIPVVAEKDAPNFGTHLTKRIDELKDHLHQENEAVEIAFDLDEVFGYHLTGTKAVILGVRTEGGIKSKEQLHELSRQQIKYATIRYSHLGHEAMQQGPLTLEEKELIKTMNELGMTIDVTGCNEDFIREVLEVSTQPIVATEAVSKGFAKVTEKALSDEIMKAITDAHGVVMLTLPGRDDDGHALSTKDVARMIIHAEQICGYTNIGFSTGLHQSLPLGLHSPADVIKITMELLRQGMPAFKISPILGRNFLCLLADNETHIELL